MISQWLSDDLSMISQWRPRELNSMHLSSSSSRRGSHAVWSKRSERGWCSRSSDWQWRRKPSWSKTHVERWLRWWCVWLNYLISFTSSCISSWLYKRGWCSRSDEYLMNIRWTSDEYLIWYLINIWWISDEYLMNMIWISDKFWWISNEYLLTLVCLT